MIALLCFFLTLFGLPFKSKSRLEAENAALRHQLIVLRRRVADPADSPVSPLFKRIYASQTRERDAHFSTDRQGRLAVHIFGQISACLSLLESRP